MKISIYYIIDDPEELDGYYIIKNDSEFLAVDNTFRQDESTAKKFRVEEEAIQVALKLRKDHAEV